MDITINDIIRLPQYDKLKLIAGASGLYNTVKSCGILDYEYDSQVKSKYKHTNFRQKQLVLSSLLYAKDNEYLLLDAIKNLISKGCCGLIIKNIFKININSSILRYADQNAFPIFIIKGDELFFEEIIIDVNNMINSYASLYYYELKVVSLLNSQANNEVLERSAKDINPLFNSDLLVIYYHFKSKEFTNHYFDISKKLLKLLNIHDCDQFFYYKNGIMLIHTKEMFESNKIKEIVKPYCLLNEELAGYFCVGVSAIHHNLFELKDALTEAIYASVLFFEQNHLVSFYQDLGVYQIILPVIEQPSVVAFSAQYLKQLQEYDDENQTKLLETIKQFILANGDVEQTAFKLVLHKNTVRYRLEKISKLLDENILLKESYERVSMALKIYLCQLALKSFRENEVT